MAKDAERARAVYKAAIDLVPHRQFTFAKLWTLFAHFNLRHNDVTSARKVFGTALGLAGKPKIFKDYIEMELKLREFDRCRIIYEKFLEYDPSNATTWLRYAELERLLLDDDRAHSIYEIAINQPVDMPELVWKSYIDYEYESESFEAARELYERLLQKTEHLKVWVSFANFEASLPVADAMPRARQILQRAYDSLKEQGLVTERILLLEAWKELEVRNDPESPHVAQVKARFPRIVQKRVKEADSTEYNEHNEHGEYTEYSEYSEYSEYIFPEDEVKPQTGKLLEMAHKWKKAKTEAAAETAETDQ